MKILKNVIPFSVRKWTELGVAVPPARCFDELMGVEGASRYVALWCQDDVVFWSDGREIFAGNTQVWFFWRWTVGIDVVRKYCFGLRDRDADHYMILDRVTRRCYAAPADVALEDLSVQVNSRAVAAISSGSQRASYHDVKDSDYPNDPARDAAMSDLEDWLMAEYRNRSDY